jgi:hypothetical protein
MSGKINFIPHNRYLLIKNLEEEGDKRESAVLLPEDYQPKKTGFVAVEVLTPSKDAEKYWNATVVVARNTIEEIEVLGEKFSIVPSNCVIGVVSQP